MLVNVFLISVFSKFIGYPPPNILLSHTTTKWSPKERIDIYACNKLGAYEIYASAWVGVLEYN